MKCCDVDLVCPICKQDTYVHIDRKQDVTMRGFGCLTCGTAEEKEGKYHAVEKPNKS